MPIAAPGRVAEPDACPICLTDLQHRGGRAIVESGCGHAMHYRCFGRLLESDALATCPMCRQRLGLSPSGNTPAAGLAAPDTPRAPRTPQARRVPRIEDESIGANWWTGGEVRMPQQLGLDAADSAVDLAGVTAVATTVPPTDPVVLEAEFSALSALGEVRVSALARICAPQSVRARAIDLVVVMDRSSSMVADGRMGFVKDALRDIVSDTLSEDDRLAVVAFDSRADLLSGLTRMDAAGKTSVIELVDSLETGSGTDILRGVRRGLGLIRARTAAGTRRAANRVLLFTDSDDELPTETVCELKAMCKSKAVTLLAYGVGVQNGAALEPRPVSNRVLRDGRFLKHLD
ncbi:hypothetical protein DFJ74DRAFT_442995 [Hyaloraphidium curvatum]|nr:hypothetical protein DFJ74DRAFT_442995 [Hyaloraphidium curvatum]